MAKALKIAGAVIVGAGLVLATGGVAAGFGLAATLGASSGVLGLSVGALILAGSSIATLGTALGRPKVPQTQTDRLYAQLNPREFRKTVLGQTAMPVDVRHEEWEGANQEWCRWIVAHASHGIDGVEEIWFGTELGWSATTGVTAKYRGYFFVDAVVLEGSPANALALSGQWNGTRRLTGCAYSAWRFKTTGNSKKAESPFSGGPPSRITVIGRGAKLYDPRRDSTVPGGSGPMRADDQSTWRFVADDGVTIGENLPLQILRMVLGGRIRNPVTGEMRLATGSGVPKRRINLQSFIVAANLADEQVNRSAGGTEPRYHGACVLSEGDEPRSWFETLCVACNARFRDTGGKLSIDIAHNDHAAAATDEGLTTDDVVGGHRWEPDASLEAIPNVVRGKYVDASAPALYQLIDYPEIRIPSLDGVDRILPLDLGAVESVSHAQRVARQALQRKQYLRTFTAPFDIRAWKYPVGALVPFTYAPLSFKRMLFRVRAQELGQNGQCVMTLAYEHPSFYAWDADDRAPVMAADPVVYDATNNPLILAIGDAAKTADWSAVADDNGLRPEDNATVGAPAGTKVGDRPVELVLEQIDQIEPIKSDISAIELTQVGHADELAALDQARVDMEAIQRQVERDAGKLDEAMLRLLSESSRTREVLRDAGIVVDPVTGVVRIYAVDQVAERTNRVEVGLDAVRSTVSLKADSDWVNERIALAVLDPVQAAELEPIIRRLAKAEVEVDGLKGTVTSKAEAIEVTKVGGRVTTAEQKIDALNGSIVNKLDKTTFAGLEATVQSIEQKLDTEGDRTGLSLNIRQARLVADDAATAALRGLLAGDEANRRQILQAADIRQDIYTRIKDGELTQAQARLVLAAQVDSVRTMTLSETTARIDALGAVARDLRSLGVTTDKQAAAIGEVNEAVIDAKGGLARNQMTIRQVVGRADTTDEALLRAIINGDDANQARQAQIVQIQTEFSTTLVANEAASAMARQALLARMNAAEAAIVDVQKVLADNIQSLVERVRASEAAWRDPETGLVATRSRLALEEKLSADRSKTNASAIENLRSAFNDPVTGLPAAFSAIGAARQTAAKDNETTANEVRTLNSTVNDPKTGLPAAFSTIGEVRDTAAKQNEATAKAVETLGSTVNNPDTGLPGAFATIGRVRDTAAKDNLATSKLVEQVKAAIDGVGNVGLQQAFEAVVDRLGKIEGRWSIIIDANKNLSGIQLIGSAAGPASFNLINTDLKMGTGRVVFDNGKFMRVQGTGFGASSEFISWFGPKMDIAQCSRANAISFEAANGDAYFGGSLSAGTFRNSSTSSTLAVDSSVVVGPFKSNSRARVLVVSYDMLGERPITTACPTPAPAAPTVTVDLYRGGNSGGVLLTSQTLTGDYECDPGFGDSEPGSQRNAISGSFTLTDNLAGENFTYFARIRDRVIPVDPQRQLLTLISTEE